MTLSATGLTGCRPTSKTAADKQDQPLNALRTEAVFAVYHEVPVELKPSIAAYHVSADLSNVINKDRFAFSDEAQNLLSKNGFLVTPSPMQEFFSIYEINRYDMTPNFITTDAMMHNYHLYFDHLLRTLEKDRLRLELYTLTKNMLQKSQEQYDALKGTDWENAAKRTVAYFAVADRILDPKSEIPSVVRSEVNDELQLIAEHQKIAPSPVMNMGNPDAGPAEILNEDYTQYIPRGHYTKSSDLKTYFQAMMWYGRLTFRASRRTKRNRLL